MTATINFLPGLPFPAIQHVLKTFVSPYHYSTSNLTQIRLDSALSTVLHPAYFGLAIAIIAPYYEEPGFIGLRQLQLGPSLLIISHVTGYHPQHLLPLPGPRRSLRLVLKPFFFALHIQLSSAVLPRFRPCFRRRHSCNLVCRFRSMRSSSRFLELSDLTVVCLLPNLLFLLMHFNTSVSQNQHRLFNYLCLTECVCHAEVEGGVWASVVRSVHRHGVLVTEHARRSHAGSSVALTQVASNSPQTK